jgi:hypothetical protein
MIYGMYQPDAAANMLNIKLGHGVAKEEEGWKPAKALNQLENAITKYYSTSSDKVAFAISIKVTDHPALVSVAEFLRYFARGLIGDKTGVMVQIEQ